jgi:hypothetical protein
VRKQNLFDLTAEVRKIIGNLPVIVGSQAVFAVTDYPPEIARLSVECDFLLLDKSFRLRDEVADKLGVFSKYQSKKGIHADVLGRATVVLPEGWENRLVELKNENGEAVALCVEIHDVAVSKLIAGREKDFEFLRALFGAELLQIEIFLERAETILRQPASEVLALRAQKFTEYIIQKKDPRAIVNRLQDFERKIAGRK